MEKIFCDFCGKEITLSMISTIEYKTDFIYYDKKEEVMISQNSIETKYDLCAECNQEFMDFLKTKGAK